MAASEPVLGAGGRRPPGMADRRHDPGSRPHPLGWCKTPPRLRCAPALHQRERPAEYPGVDPPRRRTPSMPRRNTAARRETSTATTESPAPQRRSSDPGLNHVELICGIDCVKRVRTWLDPDQADGESPPRKERPTCGRLDRLRRHPRRFIANPVPCSPARGAPTSPPQKKGTLNESRRSHSQIL